MRQICIFDNIYEYAVRVHRLGGGGATERKSSSSPACGQPSKPKFKAVRGGDIRVILGSLEG